MEQIEDMEENYIDVDHICTLSNYMSFHDLQIDIGATFYPEGLLCNVQLLNYHSKDFVNRDDIDKFMYLVTGYLVGMGITGYRGKDLTDIVIKFTFENDSLSCVVEELDREVTR